MFHNGQQVDHKYTHSTLGISMLNSIIPYILLKCNHVTPNISMLNNVFLLRTKLVNI